MSIKKMLSRILEQYALQGIDVALNDMSWSDLQSFLIEIYEQKSNNVTPQDVLKQYQSNRFVQHSSLPPQHILAFDQLAYQLLPADYQTIALSPVAPLGTISGVAPISQKMVLTTIRNNEVCSDTSNVLALEAACLRKKCLQHKEKKRERIKLCASHRVLRTQALEHAFFTPHFQLLSLCVAGRDEGSFQFEYSTLQELIQYFFNLVQQHTADNMLPAPTMHVKIFTNRENVLPFLNTLAKQLTNAPHCIVSAEKEDNENWNYYQNIRFKIFLHHPNAENRLFLCDGGNTNWTQQLLSDKKERYFISGLGSELFIKYVQACQVQKNAKD